MLSEPVDFEHDIKLWISSIMSGEFFQSVVLDTHQNNNFCMKENYLWI